MKKTVTLAIVFSLMMFIFAGAGLAADTLHTAIVEDPNSLDPHDTTMAAADEVMALIFDRLVYIDDNGEPQPWIAESWEFSEDGTEVTFQIEEGIEFHDGNILDEEAVEFTFQRLLDPETGAPAAGWLGPIDTVEATGDYEVTFYFDEPYAPFLTQLSLSYFGILSPESVKEYGDDFSRNPVGSGPMIFNNWDGGTQINLVRNDNYNAHRDDVENQGPWNFENMVFRIISEAGTRVAALETGELDVSPTPYEEVEYLEDHPGIEVFAWEDATNFGFVEFNMDKEPFDQLEMRQAVGYAINNEEITQGAQAGYATPNYNPMPVGVAGHDPEIGEEYGYHYDPEKAIELLEEIGYEDTTGDGYVDKDGERLELELWTYEVDSAVASAQIIDYQLGAVGIDTNITVMETGMLFSRLPEGEHHLNYMRWTWPDPVIISMVFGSPGHTEMFSDPEFDEIVERADTTMDFEERMEIVREAQIYLLETASTIPLFTDHVIFAHQNKVEGLRLGALGGLLFHDVEIVD